MAGGGGRFVVDGERTPISRASGGRHEYDGAHSVMGWEALPPEIAEWMGMDEAMVAFAVDCGSINDRLLR